MRCTHVLLLLTMIAALTGCSDSDSVTGFSCNPGAEVSSSFMVNGTPSTPTLNQDGVTITGSADIYLQGGLGIVGGFSSSHVDGSESVTFAFDAGAATGVSYWVHSALNRNGDTVLGAAIIEAFGPGGDSLGQVSVRDVGRFEVSDLFGAEPIGFFTVTADADGLAIAELTFSICQ